MQEKLLICIADISLVTSECCIVLHTTVSFNRLAGRLEVLQWLLAQGLLTDAYEGGLCSNAASGGHLDVLKFLRSNGFACTAETFSQAAEHGHLHILQVCTLAVHIHSSLL